MNNNTHIKKINISGTETIRVINQALREFYQKTFASGALIYNTGTELPVYSDDELVQVKNSLEAVVAATNIHFLSGKLKPTTVIDYGDVKVSVGSMMEQKINIFYITRDAIRSNGYLDTRFTDNCAFGDYVNRLSKTSFYPNINKAKLPWLFDVNHDKSGYAKHVFDQHSSGWYQYKHGEFPQNMTEEDMDNLKQSLKEHKKQGTKWLQ